MTIPQQIGLFLLGLVVLALTFRVLVKLRLLPLLLWLGVGKGLYPQWSEGHPLVFYGVLAVLVLFALTSWLPPLLERRRENRQMEKMILEDIARANVEGRTIDSIQIQGGLPITTYRE